MHIQIITLFPEMFEPVLNSSMMKIARNKKLVSFEYLDLRDFGLGLRKSVDDTPYGGGNGMVFMIEPLVSAIEKAKSSDPDAEVLLPTPRGKKYSQQEANKLSNLKGMILICPHYEGYDERVTSWVDRQYSVGDYVLTGGELPTMVIIDSVVRLIPGVLGGQNSAIDESFQGDNNQVEYTQYTRPENFRGLKVPGVLLSGHHKNIENWRLANKRKV